MSLISLQNSSELEVTILSNRFIDNFMPRANGEFVKVYIYLLRAVSSSPSSFSLEHMADRLFCTERDIFRALKYWEGEKILSLTYTTDRQLSGITLLEPFADVGHMESSASSENIFSTAGTSSSPVSAQMAAGISQPVALTGSAPKNVSLSSSNSAVSGGTSSELSTSADYIRSLTPDHISELKQNEEVSQLLYIAEQYLAKTLTPTEMQKIFFFYDELHMSADLIEYLVEYCVSRGRKSMRYIETVALAWTRDGVTTVEMARDASSRFSKDYYTILKAMGISGRNPVENEISYIDTWRKTYGFDLELIQEACSRTVLSTGQPSFQYADKILSGWKKKNVHTLEDVRLLDAEHKKRQLEKAVSRKKQPAAQSQSNNRFNNFHQRDYDFTEYEKRLLNNQ
ncbi:DnaD domain protein [Blautia sp. NSJ-166]|uniref:DnaD domain protein n=1 Tax=Blautia sp. NSJ-166 TaxID=2931882 RepID=UPI000E5D4997|nr:DnaD domain protein [Blautia sp. NSJ-166]MCJ8046946.1 DnaD domain protein [Blautia sp. NSJ-166]RGF84765.1 DnaD domain protein [Ruminococcus sp. OF03-6AA]